MSASVASPPCSDVRAEVVEKLLAALAPDRCVRRRAHRAVQPVTAAENGAAFERCAGNARRRRPRPRSDGPALRLVVSSPARSTRAGIRGILVVLRDVDADARHLLEQRAFAELVLDEPALAFGQVAECRRLAEDVLEDVETNRGLVVGRSSTSTLREGATSRPSTVVAYRYVKKTRTSYCPGAASGVR